jgi:hypothetical protein
MSRPVPNLRVVAPADQPPPSYAYEAEQRRRIAAKNWAAIHVRGDRSQPLPFFDRVLRTWR